MNRIYDLYEDTQPGEDNCVTVNVGPDDSKEVVMANILKLVEEFEANKGWNIFSFLFYRLITVQIKDS